MKTIVFASVLMFAALSMTGCGAADRGLAKFTGQPVAVCYKGVEYIQLTSGASVAYNVDGTVKTCK